MDNCEFSKDCSLRTICALNFKPNEKPPCASMEIERGETFKDFWQENCLFLPDSIIGAEAIGKFMQKIWYAALKKKPPNNVVERTLPPQFAASDVVGGRVCMRCRPEASFVEEPCVSCKGIFTNFVPLANETER